VAWLADAMTAAYSVIREENAKNSHTVLNRRLRIFIEANQAADYLFKPFRLFIKFLEKMVAESIYHILPNEWN
jgi:hypothetical protein